MMSHLKEMKSIFSFVYRWAGDTVGLGSSALRELPNKSSRARGPERAGEAINPHFGVAHRGVTSKDQTPGRDGDGGGR